MDKLHVEWLDSHKYQGFPLTFQYTTDRYYHVQSTEWGMNLQLQRFHQPVCKQFTDTLFSSWLENPVALGAFAGDMLTGVIEGSVENWHQVFRISNLLIMERYRRLGIGSMLMKKMITYAREIPDCRGVILETQSCNFPAITFYRKHGFLLNRIDLREYSNEDIQRNEVRLDFFLPFVRTEK